MSTKVLSCNCRHEYQDKKYGENRRVMNKINKGYRCTVCGKDKIA
jgi:hypothetical protein